MGCIEAVKSFLRKSGVLPRFTNDDVKDAVTENLVVERERTMNELSQESVKFQEKSAEVEGLVADKKTDLEILLSRIRNASNPMDARDLIERMINRKRQQMYPGEH